MALQFILGNSGSGKTEYIYRQTAKEAAKNPRKNYLVIVPEQFTMQTQRKLVDVSLNKAIMNIDVLSFKRLAYRVFDELGICDLEILEETGKNLVLRKVAQEQEENLGVFRSNMKHMGYISEIKSLISELMQYNITPEMLAECVENERFSTVLTSKLKDVEIMYREFLNYLRNPKRGNGNIEHQQTNLENSTKITADELLHVLSDVAEQSALLKDATLIFDEFTGFTPIQVVLLQKLMKICANIKVTLTIDEKENFYHSRGMQELFDMPKKTIRTLMDLAKKTHTPVEEPVVVKISDHTRFSHAPSLAFMEQNLFRTTYKRKYGKTREIQIFSLKNPKEEMIWTARKINELVQTKGYRYREIAVVTGDVEGYSNYVRGIFGKYEIPYFVDTTKELLFHPFIECIRAALEVVRSDFSYQSIMRLLRTGFVDMTADEMDNLENYLIAIGIRGKKQWSRRWLRKPKSEQLYDLEKLEQLRILMMEKLEPFAAVFMNKKTTTGEKIEALYAFIVSIEAQKKLFEMEGKFLEAGEQAKAKEYEQIYRIVMELLEKCHALLADDIVTIEEFEEILDSGFEAAEVAVIPPGYDSVTIGDIERTRLNHVKVLFFVGVNDGIVPKSTNTGGIISEYERAALEEAEITLAPCAREQAFIQKFYLYLNMTKPSEQLYVSFARVDREGKTQRPSYLIRILQRMFPDMGIAEIDEVERILDASTAESAKDYLISGEKDTVWYALAKCFLESEDEKLRRKAMEIVDAFYYHYSHDPISRVVAEAVYGKSIEGSITRLENFAKCAYSHFLQYGLHLRERETSGFESVDMGNLYHAAIEIYSKKLADSPYNWFSVPEEKRDEFAEHAMEEAVLAYPNLSIYATAQDAHMAKRMNHIFKQTVWALTTQVRKGRFVPNDFEIAFSKTDRLDALFFELGEAKRLRLAGRIDRVDTCEDDGRLYVKVIDYKSGNTKFDFIQLYNGLQLQLVVYMNAAMELEKKKHPNMEVIPGGLFYYHIDDPVIEVTGEISEEEIQQAILKELKPDGLVNREDAIYRAMDDEFETKSDVIPVTIKKSGELSESQSKVASTEEFGLISRYVNKQIEDSGKQIYDGNVQINPYVDGQNGSCTYCPYKSVCGFDLKISGFEERRFKKMEKAEVFDRMETELARK
uniref:PD-(D/E)XK nuclease family protein n=1 Tax=Agathobacter sp. TaxID=2021311 RepID=UPI0040571354